MRCRFHDEQLSYLTSVTVQGTGHMNLKPLSEKDFSDRVVRQKFSLKNMLSREILRIKRSVWADDD